jgi:CRISPR/Cas system-associated exonuclease Cas4 (RecB family)
MALNALYGEAQRFSGLPHAAATRRTDAPIVSDVVRPTREHPQVAEIPIHSKDGMIVGRVDLAEYTDDGPHLIDYKSAVRDDLPERYQRQLLLYAALWFEMFDEWPAKATLVYPFTGTLQDIPLTVAACRATLEEARTSIRQLQSAAPAESKATPGDVCHVCTYRPWCRPFWRFQASEQNDHVALERSRMGVQGQVKQLTTIDQHWKLLLQWRNATLKLVAPYERFPQLAGVASGATLRLLNIRLHGQRSSPQVEIYDNTEIFIVRQ